MRYFSNTWFNGLASILICMTSCQEEIDLDFHDEQPRLMIEGKISDSSGLQEVIITRSVAFNDYNEFPAVINAQVWISDETSQISDSLISTFPGVYNTDKIKGIPGHLYNLKVLIDDKLYVSSCIMPEKVEIDSLTQMKILVFTKEKIGLVAHFTDPAKTGNCYRFVKYTNGLQSRSFFVRNDIFTNGNVIEQSLRDENIEIVSGDTMMVEMQCVDPRVYEYFNTLMQLQGDNIYQGKTPSNPVSNISGGCLGYFSAYTVSRKHLVIYAN